MLLVFTASSYIISEGESGAIRPLLLKLNSMVYGLNSTALNEPIFEVEQDRALDRADKATIGYVPQKWPFEAKLEHWLGKTGANTLMKMGVDKLPLSKGDIQSLGILYQLLAFKFQKGMQTGRLMNSETAQKKAEEAFLSLRPLLRKEVPAMPKQAAIIVKKNEVKVPKPASLPTGDKKGGLSVKRPLSVKVPRSTAITGKVSRQFEEALGTSRGYTYRNKKIKLYDAKQYIKALTEYNGYTPEDMREEAITEWGFPKTKIKALTPEDLKQFMALAWGVYYTLRKQKVGEAKASEASYDVANYALKGAKSFKNLKNGLYA